MNNIYKKYIDNLIKWGGKTDLIGTLDPEEIYNKHIIDCLELSNIIDRDARSVVDLGTGAGLPGIIIKINHPELETFLVDSKRKKIGFCNFMISELGLEEIKAIWGNAGDRKTIEEVGQIDLVVSRATWSLKDYLPIAMEYQPRLGIMAMKGPALKEEVIDASKIIEQLGLIHGGEHHYILPNREKRIIIKFNKCFT